MNDWDAKRYVANAAFVSDYGHAVADLLGDIKGLRVLDVGCGDGRLTQELVSRGATVVGVDSSVSMIESAKEKGLDATVMDGAALTFDQEFDRVFTNATLHWIPDHDAVCEGMYRALKPGGILVGEFGGFGNVAAINTAVKGALWKNGYEWRKAKPVTYPSPQRFGERLESAGFNVETIGLIPRPTPLPTGMRGWLETFGLPFLSEVPEHDRSRIFDEAVELLEPALMDEYGNWIADYIRIRFLASKPT